MPLMDHETGSPQVLRDKSGEIFDIVDRCDHTMLLPVSDDPLETLREEVEGTNKSVDRLKKEALESAMKEAGR